MLPRFPGTEIASGYVWARDRLVTAEADYLLSLVGIAPRRNAAPPQSGIGDIGPRETSPPQSAWPIAPRGVRGGEGNLRVSNVISPNDRIQLEMRVAAIEPGVAGRINAAGTRYSPDYGVLKSLLQETVPAPGSTTQSLVSELP
jgi:hypothetical protein